MLKAMFEKYPDVVEVDQLGNARRYPAESWHINCFRKKKYIVFELDEPIRFRRHVSLNTYCAKKCVISRLANLSLPAID